MVFGSNHPTRYSKHVRILPMCPQHVADVVDADTGRLFRRNVRRKEDSLFLTILLNVWANFAQRCRYSSERNSPFFGRRIDVSAEWTRLQMTSTYRALFCAIVYSSRSTWGRHGTRARLERFTQESKRERVQHNHKRITEIAAQEPRPSVHEMGVACGNRVGCSKHARPRGNIGLRLSCLALGKKTQLFTFPLWSWRKRTSFSLVSTSGLLMRMVEKSIASRAASVFSLSVRSCPTRLLPELRMTALERPRSNCRGNRHQYQNCLRNRYRVGLLQVRVGPTHVGTGMGGHDPCGYRYGWARPMWVQVWVGATHVGTGMGGQDLCGYRYGWAGSMWVWVWVGATHVGTGMSGHDPRTRRSPHASTSTPLHSFNMQNYVLHGPQKKVIALTNASGSGGGVFCLFPYTNEPRGAHNSTIGPPCHVCPQCVPPPQCERGRAPPPS